MKFVKKIPEHACAKKVMEVHAVISVFQDTTTTRIVFNVTAHRLEVFRLLAI